MAPAGARAWASLRAPVLEAQVQDVPLRGLVPGPVSRLSNYQRREKQNQHTLEAQFVLQFLVCVHLRQKMPIPSAVPKGA